VYGRGNCEVPGEREYKREKNDSEILTWERGERKQVLDVRGGKKVLECYEERETIEHMWNGCSEMREREGKERGLI
jgi:hypothetical protein